VVNILFFQSLKVATNQTSTLH